MLKIDRHSRTFRIASWLAVALMLVVVFWFSAQDATTLNEDLGGISAIKAWLAQTAAQIFGRQVDVSPIGHSTEYLLLGASIANALSLPNKEEEPARRICGIEVLPKTVLLSTILSSLYGATDEFHQIFTPGRSCDPADWLVDTLAALIGAAIVAIVLKHHASRR